MTDLSDLDLMDATTPPTVNVSTKRCYRHDWANRQVRIEDGVGYFELVCDRCGKVRDEAVVRRNRNNRQRGGAFERTVAKKLGGRKTGPLGGRDDVMVGEFAAIQTKRAARFSLTEARTYLADLRRTYPTRVPLVVHALPGERGGVVILAFEDWEALHGAEKETT